MFQRLIILSLCSCFLVSCGKKGYPPPEKLTNQEITDILVKELGASRVDSWRHETKTFCVMASKTKEESNSCKEKKGELYEKEWREKAVQEYNRYILNVLND